MSEHIELAARKLHDEFCLDSECRASEPDVALTCHTYELAERAVEAGVKLSEERKATREYESSMRAELWLAERIADAKAEGAREEREQIDIVLAHEESLLPPPTGRTEYGQGAARMVERIRETLAFVRGGGRISIRARGEEQGMTADTRARPRCGAVDAGRASGLCVTCRGIRARGDK